MCAEVVLLGRSTHRDIQNPCECAAHFDSSPEQSGKSGCHARAEVGRSELPGNDNRPVGECGAGNPARCRLSAGWTRWKAGPRPERPPHSYCRSLTFIAVLANAALHGQSLAVYSEFQRVDPFGQIVAVDRGPQPREILSPAAPRNGFVSFHIAVTGPPGLNYFLYIVTSPLN